MNVMRCRFTKLEDMIYISHLDILRLFDKAIRRAKIRIAFSQGFNPHPKISFGHALSLGMKSNAEYVDIELVDELSAKEFQMRMNKALPSGLQFTNVKVVNKSDPSLITIITHAEYEIKFKLKEDIAVDELQNRFDEFLKNDEIIQSKINKKGKLREINIRELIEKLQIQDYKDNVLTLNALLVNSASENLKASVLVEKLNELCDLNIDNEYFDMMRLNFYIKENDKYNLPM